MTAREYIYLDAPKISSYLSQINNGLSLLVQRVEAAYSSKETQDASSEEVTRAAVEASLGGRLPLVGEASGRVSWGKDRTTTPINKRLLEHDEAQRTDLTILHHKAFDIVMEQLAEEFVVVKGTTLIIPFDELVDLFKEEISGASLDDSEDATSASPKGLEYLAGLKLGYAAYVENRQRSVHAFLLPEHFTTPPLHFYVTYGAPAQVEFTMVGLYANNPTKTPKFLKQLSGTMMGELVNTLESSMSEFREIIAATSGWRLYPLAIYRDLDFSHQP